MPPLHHAALDAVFSWMHIAELQRLRCQRKTSLTRAALAKKGPHLQCHYRLQDHQLDTSASLATILVSGSRTCSSRLPLLVLLLKGRIGLLPSEASGQAAMW